MVGRKLNQALLAQWGVVSDLVQAFRNKAPKQV